MMISDRRELVPKAIAFLADGQQGRLLGNGSRQMPIVKKILLYWWLCSGGGGSDRFAKTADYVTSLLPLSDLTSI